MKKKLAGLNLRVQIGLVAFGLVLLAAAGFLLVVSPESAQVGKLQLQIDAQNTQIYQRRAAARAGLHPPAIQTADLFRLARAMPDREDMPGIILTLSETARAAGITFNLIEPVIGGAPPALAGPYTLQRIHLLFNGDFYGLSDFLYRLRSLVAVHDGKLEASGRLFNVDTVTFNVLANSFPQISAELYVDAYIYSTAPAASSSSTTPSTTTPSTTTTETTPATSDSSLPSSATAVGANP